MRSLKFRAWDKDLCKYLEGCEISSLMADFDAEGDGREIIIKQICPARYIFEQYIGLKDKNSKEIYEGDVIKMPDWQTSPRTEIVKYHKAGFDPFQESCLECWSADGEEVEVIGNIHENKDLIGGEE